MSSCCGACGGQDTAPKKDQKQFKTKEEQKKEASKPEFYVPEAPSKANHTKEK